MLTGDSRLCIYMRNFSKQVACKKKQKQQFKKLKSNLWWVDLSGR